MRKTRRRTGRGSVMLITMLFIASAVVRLSTYPGFAFAENTHSDEEAHVESDPQTKDALTRPQIASLLDALRAREDAVSERELKAEVRSKALAAADVEIRERLLRLEETENRLRETLALADSAAENDITRLVAVYENMKPKDAAALFETMEPSFAAGFLARMRPESAAAVLTGLSPEVAYSISVILAGRNANVPKT